MLTSTQLRPRLLLLCSCKNGGFTLLEMLVVVIIAGILAAIAIPSFLNQTHRAKQVEGKAHVGLINRAQQAYYTEKLQFTPNIGDLGLSLQTQTTSYSYDISVNTAAGDVAVNSAVSRSPYIKSYVGMVALVSLTVDTQATRTILCEASNPGATRAADPTLAANALSCSAGTVPLN